MHYVSVHYKVIVSATVQRIVLSYLTALIEIDNNNNNHYYTVK